MKKVMITPVGSSYTMKDFNATVEGNTWAFWDDSQHNNSELYQCFAFVSNRSNCVVATGQIVGITEDTNPFVQHALLAWEAHKPGRRVLLLRMDKEPIFKGRLDEIFTKSGIVMGTGNRTLLDGVVIKHNPFNNP